MENISRNLVSVHDSEKHSALLNTAAKVSNPDSFRQIALNARVKQLGVLKSRMNVDLAEFKGKLDLLSKKQNILEVEIEELKCRTDGEEQEVSDSIESIADQFRSLNLPDASKKLMQIKEKCESFQDKLIEISQLKEEITEYSKGLQVIKNDIDNADSGLVKSSAKLEKINDSKLLQIIASLLSFAKSLLDFLSLIEYTDEGKASVLLQIKELEACKNDLQNKLIEGKKAVDQLTETVASLEKSLSFAKEFDSTMLKHVELLQQEIKNLQQNSLPFIKTGSYKLTVGEGETINANACRDNQGKVVHANAEDFKIKPTALESLKYIENILGSKVLPDQPIKWIQELQSELKDQWHKFQNTKQENLGAINDKKVYIAKIIAKRKEISGVVDNIISQISAIDKLMIKADSTNLNGLFNMEYSSFLKIVSDMYKEYKLQLEDDLDNESPSFNTNTNLIDNFIANFQHYFFSNGIDINEKNKIVNQIKNTLSLFEKQGNEYYFLKDDTTIKSTDNNKFLLGDFDFFWSLRADGEEVSDDHKVDVFLSQALSKSTNAESRLYLRNQLISELDSRPL